VVFAASAVPIIGILGLSVDVTFVTQAKSQLALAADAASLSATKLASNEFVAGNATTYATDGQTNGNQWFDAQLGALHGVGSHSRTTTVTRNGTVFTTNVAYSATIPTHFASLFGHNFSSFTVSGQSNSTITINAYMNIEMLLDNSGSMLIGASTADINTLQAITACSPMAGGSGQGTSAWSTTMIPATCPTTYAANVSSPGAYPVAGHAPNSAPCGFACHWNANTDSVLINGGHVNWDYFALARNVNLGPITGYTNPTLRFDVVQAAAANVVSTMISNEILTNQFQLGAFTFNSSLVRVWPASPSSAEASTDLAGGATAIASIPPYVGPNGGNTNFPGSMTSLASIMTNAGDGSSSSSPRKTLFIVTDGIQDYGSRSLGSSLGPMNDSAATAACNAIKAKGIGIYVLYTPYVPLPYNPYYVGNIAQYVSGTPNAITRALQSCASAPSFFYEADIPSQVTSGLLSLVSASVRAPARISS